MRKVIVEGKSKTNFEGIKDKRLDPSYPHPIYGVAVRRDFFV